MKILPTCFVLTPNASIPSGSRQLSASALDTFTPAAAAAAQTEDKHPALTGFKPTEIRVFGDADGTQLDILGTLPSGEKVNVVLNIGLHGTGYLAGVLCSVGELNLDQLEAVVSGIASTPVVTMSGTMNGAFPERADIVAALLATPRSEHI